MNSRKLSAALVTLLILLTLLSGTLLILHSEHSCSETMCPTCTMLENSLNMLRNSIALISVAGLVAAIRGCLVSGPPEDRYVPDWTPVRRKVKLLD